MSMIFKFRMLSDENDDFIREYEVPYDMNLLDFNNFICDDLKYDSNVMSSFFLSDSQWEKSREFTLTDMDMGGCNNDNDCAPSPMSSVTLGQIIHKNKDRLIYLFDMFGDRAYYIELIEAKKQESDVVCPRTVLSIAEPSDQFDANAEGTTHGSIFDEVMEEFDDFDESNLGDDYSDDEY